MPKRPLLTLKTKPPATQSIVESTDKNKVAEDAHKADVVHVVSENKIPRAAHAGVDKVNVRRDELKKLLNMSAEAQEDVNLGAVFEEEAKESKEPKKGAS